MNNLGPPRAVSTVVPSDLLNNAKPPSIPTRPNQSLPARPLSHNQKPSQTAQQGLGSSPPYPTTQDPLSHLLHTDPLDKPDARPTDLPRRNSFADDTAPLAARYPISAVTVPDDASRPALPPKPPILDDYVDDFLRSSPAVLPNPENVAPSLGGVRLLARMRAWHQVKKLTTRMLESNDAKEDSKLDDVRLFYFFAQLKLTRPPHTELQTELVGFLHELDAQGRTREDKCYLTLLLLQIDLKQYVDTDAPKEIAQAAQQRSIDELTELQRWLFELAMRGDEEKPAPSSSSASSSVSTIGAPPTPSSSISSSLTTPLQQQPEGGGGGGETPVVTVGASSVMSTDEALLWWRRVTMSIVNTAIRAVQWETAMIMLELLRRHNTPPSLAHSGGLPREKQSSTMTLPYDIEILTRIGKVFLQMGNLTEATNFFRRASDADKRLNEALGGNSSSQTKSRTKLNDGLLCFARDDFTGAMVHLEEVISSERAQQHQSSISSDFDTPPSSLTSSLVPETPSPLFCGIDVETSVLVEAVNNYAIGAMYTCEIDKAVETLETLIIEDPTANMREVVVFNLCTLYELSCDNKKQIRSKRVLQQVALRYKLDDIDAACFRIP